MAGEPRLFLARRVETLDARAGAADALVTTGGRVAAVGGRGELARRFPGLPVTDLGDAVVVPGFDDAHQHPSLVAADLLHVDLSPEAAPTLAAAKAALAREARRLPPGEWVRGSRYDEAKLAGGGSLSRADLDEVAPDHPVVVSHVSAHWGVASSRALALAGLSDASQPPPGGALGRDAAGRLNGVLSEQAFFDFAYAFLATGEATVPSPPLEDWLRGLDRLQERLAAAGLTSVTDALAGPAELRLFQEARARGRLRLRVGLLVTYPYLGLLEELGVRTGFGDEWLRIDGVKVILDGAVSAGTCLAGTPIEKGAGIQVMETGRLRAVVEQARRAGCRLAVHANGDQAIGILLDELERADRLLGPPRVPERVEHCSMVTPRIVERMAARRMAAVPFGAYAWFHGPRLLALYGAERLERMFAHRTLLDAGITVAGSSDHPCGPFEPLVALRSCVTRRSADGRVLGPSQRIATREALGVYTAGSAAAAGLAGVKGRLAPGCLADFVALGADPLATPPDELAGIPVRATFVGGEPVWRAPGVGVE